MFRHVVMFRWKDDAPGDAAELVSARLAELPGLIPEIRSYRFGPDAGLAEGNYDYAVVADFDDADGWKRYAVDEHHQRAIVETIRPLIAERAAVQYELEA